MATDREVLAELLAALQSILLNVGDTDVVIHVARAAVAAARARLVLPEAVSQHSATFQKLWDESPVTEQQDDAIAAIAYRGRCIADDLIQEVAKQRSTMEELDKT